MTRKSNFNKNCFARGSFSFVKLDEKLRTIRNKILILNKYNKILKRTKNG